MTTDIRLDSLWTLRELQQRPETWTLYVNQIALFATQALRDAFYDPGQPALAVADDSDLLSQLRILVAEVQVRLPQVQEIEGFQLSARLSALTHWPTGRWAEQSYPSQRIQWTRELKLGDQSFGNGTDCGHLEIAKLSDIAQAAVARLDGLTVETAYRRHYEKLQRVQDVPADQLPPPKKVRVFVSYRRSCINAAKSLHALLQWYASGTVFEPYLDYHNMRTGEWFAQLMKRIEEADVFMPLVSDDYAADGTVGRKELDKAAEVAHQRTLESFFSPIFAGSQVQAGAAFLREHDGLVLRSITEIAESNKEIQHYLGRVATSVLAREGKAAGR